MATPVMEFQVWGYKIRKIFAEKSTLLNFENWCNGELSNIGHHFSNKVIKNIDVMKNVLLNWYFSMTKMRKIQMIFGIEN